MRRFAALVFCCVFAVAMLFGSMIVAHTACHGCPKTGCGICALAVSCVHAVKHVEVVTPSAAVLMAVLLCAFFDREPVCAGTQDPVSLKIKLSN